MRAEKTSARKACHDFFSRTANEKDECELTEREETKADVLNEVIDLRILHRSKMHRAANHR